MSILVVGGNVIKKLLMISMVLSYFMLASSARAYVPMDHELSVGWHFLSFPGDNTAYTPAGAFKDTAGGAIPISGKLISRDPATQTDIVYNTSNPVAFFGNRVDHLHGYWLKIENPTTLRVNVNQVLSETHIQLYSGLNTFGYPYTVAQNSANLQVKNLTTKETKNIEEARNLGWVSSTLMRWDKSKQGLINISSLADDYCEEGILEPWSGYWIQSFKNDIELIIPYHGQ